MIDPVALGVQAVVAASGIAVMVGTVKQTVAGLLIGQDHLSDTIEKLSIVVGSLNASMAAGDVKHQEIDRRIIELTNAVIDHAERIGILRTRSHLLASKLMELDPKFHPFMDV